MSLATHLQAIITKTSERMPKVEIGAAELSCRGSLCAGRHDVAQPACALDTTQRPWRAHTTTKAPMLFATHLKAMIKKTSIRTTEVEIGAA